MEEAASATGLNLSCVATEWFSVPLWLVSELMLLIRDMTFPETATVHSTPPSDYLSYCGENKIPWSRLTRRGEHVIQFMAKRPGRSCWGVRGDDPTRDVSVCCIQL